MALVVSEMTGVARRGPVQVPPYVEQQVAITASSVQSDAFSDRTRIIRIVADVACHIVIGANPTATTGNFPVMANEKEHFEVQPGDKIAVITA